jgi:hypothetical protein
MNGEELTVGAESVIHSGSLDSSSCRKRQQGWRGSISDPSLSVDLEVSDRNNSRLD